MKQLRAYLCVAVGAALLAACSTNGTSIGPTVSQANLSADKLQMAVGTENDGNDGVVNLNVVATFRQPNGDSAVLLDTPTITGPAGFVVPLSAPPMDAGTDHISGSPQVLPNQTPEPTTFSSSGGVFSYGFGPFNSDNAGDPFYPGNPPLYAQPFYTNNVNGGVNVVGGPPAYPFFNDGSYPPFFEGYSQGFSAFETTPVTGTYTLSVNIPIVGTPGVNKTASANLTTTTPLGLPSNVSLTEDGAGGGTANVTVTDPNVTETMIYIEDTSSVNLSGQAQPLFFSVGPLTGTGPLSGNLPDDLGYCGSPGCHSAPSMNPGDNYIMFAVSYDWPMFESSPSAKGGPNNRQILPTIVGANGQADDAISPAAGFTYGGGGIRHHIRPRAFVVPHIHH